MKNGGVTPLRLLSVITFIPRNASRKILRLILTSFRFLASSFSISVDVFLVCSCIAAKVIVMASERYSFSLTTFSPSGKLVQIEYALAAVAAGAPSVGIKALNGVVLATENKHKSILYDEHSVSKVEMITKHIGMVYSGMGPDYRLLVKQARKMAQQYLLVYREPIPTAQLVQRVAMVMQEYTQSGGVRPFGVSLLICGWDNDRPYLFQCDPSGTYFAWKATAMGKNFVNGKTFLEKRYSEDLELDDAVHTAILTLKEGFEGQMTADNIEVGICDANGFRKLDPSNVKDYLANIP